MVLSVEDFAFCDQKYSVCGAENARELLYNLPSFKTSVCDSNGLILD